MRASVFGWFIYLFNVLKNILSPNTSTQAHTHAAHTHTHISKECTMKENSKTRSVTFDV